MILENETVTETTGLLFVYFFLIHKKLYLIFFSLLIWQCAIINTGYGKSAVYVFAIVNYNVVTTLVITNKNRNINMNVNFPFKISHAALILNRNFIFDKPRVPYANLVWGTLRKRAPSIYCLGS